MIDEPLKRNLPISSAVVMLTMLGLGGLLLCISFNLIMTLAGLAEHELVVLKITVVLQNILTFILPAVFFAWFIAFKPFSFLRVDRAPSLKSILLLLLVFVFMTPAMNYIIEWNESLKLPEFLSGLEEWMKASEDAAKAATEKLVDTSSFGNMVIAVLSIGVLTGIGEEFFFRGALQGFLCKHMNYHWAVWIAAFVFSLMHFQFYGFVPRMLLGALFGYMFVWSGSLWLPIIGHAFNNSSVVVSQYLMENGIIEADISKIGYDSVMLIVSSAVVTLLILIAWNKKLNKAKNE